MADLKVTGLCKAFGGVVALAGIDLSVELGEIVGIVGPNGSGKTTLFNIITGTLSPSAGQVLWQGEDITGKPAYEIARLGIGRTFQQAMAFPRVPVHENVCTAWEHGSRVTVPRRHWKSPDELLDFVDLRGFRAVMAGTLPFGCLRKLGLAVALAANPRLLLLDEPAAGLNDTETEQLAGLIAQLPAIGIGVCVIDHDMDLIASLCNRLVVLDFGTKIAEGPPAAVLNDAKVLEVYLGVDL